MSDKFQNKYRIPTNRLGGFDYGANAKYFVTICTQNRVHYFGEIVETGDYPSGNNVETDNCTSEIKTNNFSNNKTDNCPSLHLNNYKMDNCPSLRATEIGRIAEQFWLEIPQHYPFVILEEFVIMPNHIHGVLFFNNPEKTDWTPNEFGIQSKNLGAVIRAYKSSVKRYANQNNLDFEWQPRYHDHIIRDDKEWFAIRNYITNNPQNWNKDSLNAINS